MRQYNRVLGPYTERDRFRLVIIEGETRRAEYLYTIEAAESRKAQLERQLKKREGVTVAVLLTEYMQQKEAAGNATPRTCLEQSERLLKCLEPFLKRRANSITPPMAARLYDGLVAEPSEKTGLPLAAATHRFYLKLIKAMFAYAVLKQHIKKSPFVNVAMVGKVRTGKPQLRIDEARRFVSTALKLFETDGNRLALAAVMALTMGLRASEIVKRRQRDLDDDCGILWIDSGKTENAKRHLRIPEFLRPYLRQIQSGPSDAPLFPGRKGTPYRYQSLGETVRRICEGAGVAVVCTHSLRGLYATLAIESGAMSETVAKSLGHSSFSVTERHYAQPSAVSNSRSARVEEVLHVG